MPSCVGSESGEITLASCTMRTAKGVVSHFLLSMSNKSAAPVAPMCGESFAPVATMGSKSSKQLAGAVLYDAVALHVCESKQGLGEANHREGRHVLSAGREGTQGWWVKVCLLNNVDKAAYEQDQAPNYIVLILLILIFIYKHTRSHYEFSSTQQLLFIIININILLLLRKMRV
jgi:hypothetical protein